MAELNFKKLADAPILESVPDGAKVYAEVDGKVYRVAGDNLGGGVKTAVFRFAQEEQPAPSSLREAGVATASAGDNARASGDYVYGECENMTYEEVKAMLLAGKPLAGAAVGILESGGVPAAGMSFTVASFTACEEILGPDVINIEAYGGPYYWHPDGTFTNDPDYGQGEPI